MFQFGVHVGIVGAFIELTDRPHFARLSRAASAVPVTAAQILDFPLDNMSRAVAPQSMIASLRSLIDQLASRLTLDNRSVEALRCRMSTIAQLQVFICSNAVRPDGGFDMCAGQLMKCLTDALTRNCRDTLPTDFELWRELIRDTGFPVESSWHVNVMPVTPFMCEIWLQEHPGEQCTIREVMLMMVDDAVPPLQRALPMIRHMVEHNTARYGRERHL